MQRAVLAAPEEEPPANELLRAASRAAEAAAGDPSLVPWAAALAERYAASVVRPLLQACQGPSGRGAGRAQAVGPLVDGGAVQAESRGARAPLLLDDLLPCRPVSIARGMAAVAMLASPWGPLVQPSPGSPGLHPFAELALQLTRPWAQQPLVELFVYTDGSYAGEAPWGGPWCTWAFVVVAKDHCGAFVRLGAARGHITVGDTGVLAPQRPQQLRG